MFDFLRIKKEESKKGTTIISPQFVVGKHSDLMIRGGDFYAIWDSEKSLWITDENEAIRMIDDEIRKYYEAYLNKNPEQRIKVNYLWDSTSKQIDTWHHFCQKALRDNFKPLDEKLIFANEETKKQDYASKKLPYPIVDGSTESFDTLMSVLYSPKEREKLEWAIGAIVTGDSKKIQKFMVLYGSAGTGKSTFLNIVQMLFDGYCAVFDAKALGSSTDSFALEPFKNNPLVGIQHDGDLSRIEDNTRLNSLVSHEIMIVNEKFSKKYSSRFNTFLFMGTNKPVMITDAKSGILRRLIDVSPTGEKIPYREYRDLMKKISFELGAIASKCKKEYLKDPDRYDDYIPTGMMTATNDFYDFVLTNYFIFLNEDGVSLKTAWEMYKTYCDEAKTTTIKQRIFKEELKSYFRNFDEVFSSGDQRIRSYYSGFRKEKFKSFERNLRKEEKAPEKPKTFIFKKQHSLLDDILKDFPAQYANEDGTPKFKWSNVSTTLKDIDTSKLHYVLVPKNHIVIDFDIPDENGNKSFEKNIEEAEKWLPTYAELSKSGQGIHLHYMYDGDVSELSRLYSDHIEIKVFSGKSSLRRMLTKCNDIPIATISSGLPLKEKKRMINSSSIKNEKELRRRIIRNLQKQIWPNTKPSIDLIAKNLQDAYDQGLTYDVSDMRTDILAFAASSTHNADYCIKLVNKMKFKSEDAAVTESVDDRIVFYDVEVFPNLFLVNWKFLGDKSVTRLINPKPKQIEDLLKYKLVGFNCRRYDNHILYAALMGYSNAELYRLSQKIINGKKDNREAFFGEAYNLSYTDIYDYAATKQSLKKWEIQLGIHHQELGLPWDEPVPEEMWTKVAEYCDNDVIATEAVWNATKDDFLAREILADIAGMTVNDTTNSLTTRIIFGKERHPQLVYTDLATGNQEGNPLNGDLNDYTFKDSGNGVVFEKFSDPFTRFNDNGQAAFPGYIYEHNGLTYVSVYRGEVTGEGGYVRSKPGIYHNVAVLDIMSMHPHSAKALNLFGEYTKNFVDLVDVRIAIKHKDFDKAKKMLNGKLAKYLDDPKIAKRLAYALKIAINSVYGLTSASFDNPFRDNRNRDNIVAKRGALFMINLQHLVKEKGFDIVHIKTDSIKIPNATVDIIKFCQAYAELYGYTFEHESTYDRFCLVNDADYVAKYASIEQCIALYSESYVNSSPDVLANNKESQGFPWTVTGAKFAVPYVFKTLFSHEPVIFQDTCEVKEVKTALYLDFNESLPEGEHEYRFIGRIGRFTPVLPGNGGGLLLRSSGTKEKPKYDSANGCKGYRWLESETIPVKRRATIVDISYYRKLVDEAIAAIEEYGSFEEFIS